MTKYPFGTPIFDSREKSYLKKTLDSKILVHGLVTKKFEEKFKKFTKSKNAVSVSSCTAGMHLIYFAMGLKKGDEVILPAMTHVATAHAIELTGAKAVFVDCDNKTGNINIDDIEKKINKKTKAVAIVHFLGISVELDKIIYLCKKYKIFLLEDCALALGSKYKKKHVGNFGIAGVFSFYPVKHITSAEGGMIITNNNKLAKKLKLLKAFGVNKNFAERSKPGNYNTTLLGFNYRMSEIHASIGLAQMFKINDFLKKREKNFLLLKRILERNKNLFILDSQSKKSKNSFYCLNVVLKNNISKKRDLLIKKLSGIGIGTSIYYPHPVKRMIYYKNKYGFNKKDYKNSEIISDNSISLPVGPHLKSKDILYIGRNFLSELNKL